LGWQASQKYSSNNLDGLTDPERKNDSSLTNETNLSANIPSFWRRRSLSIIAQAYLQYPRKISLFSLPIRLIILKLDLHE
jgi:hypothetical protein